MGLRSWPRAVELVVVGAQCVYKSILVFEHLAEFYERPFSTCESKNRIRPKGPLIEYLN